MRPIARGDSPQAGDFDPYRSAFPFLKSRLGPYCSFCERRIYTNLAVEHIQPKEREDPPGHYPYAHLALAWSNLLLACVNCNSTKGTRDVTLDDVFLPDRDNTFAAFAYLEDGTVQPARGLTPALDSLAAATLALTGLDRGSMEVRDENGRLVALDRVQDRAQARLIAEDSLEDWLANPSVELRRCIVRNALSEGFFSVWMDVFAGHPQIRAELIRAFPGTAADCFDAETVPVSPRPAVAGLQHGGKI